MDDEPGESALRRELREELGVEVVRSRLIGHAVHQYSAEEDTEVSFYLIEQYRGAIHAVEGQLIQWVDLCKPLSLDVIAANRRIFSAIADELCNSPDRLWDRVWAGQSRSFAHFEVRRFRVAEKLTVLKELGCRVSPDEHILDAGCGLGDAASLIAQVFGTSAGTPCVVGVDRSWVALTLPKNGVVPALVLNADVTAMPIRSESIDKVFALSVLEHVRDADLLLSELRRVLVPGGEIYFCQSNMLSVLTVDRLLRQWANRWPYGYQASYTPRQLVRLLSSLFKVEGVAYDMPHSDVPMYRYIDTVVHGFWRSWGRNVFVKARKN